VLTAAEVRGCGSTFSGGIMTEYSPRTKRHAVVGLLAYGHPACAGGAVFTPIDQGLKWMVKSPQRGECHSLMAGNLLQ